MGSTSFQQSLGNVVIEGINYVKRLSQDSSLILIMVEEAYRFVKSREKLLLKQCLGKARSMS